MYIPDTRTINLEDLSFIKEEPDIQEMVLVKYAELKEKLYDCINAFMVKGRIEDSDTRKLLYQNILNGIKECNHTKDES